MYNDLVKALLEKHFGPPRNSLTIGDAGAPDGTIYYYHLNRENEIAAIRDLLGMKHLVDGIDKLPELKQSIPEKGEEAPEISQCARFSVNNGHWYVSVYEITGVTYHRTYGNRVAATLQLHNYPMVELSDRNNDFYGFWKKMRKKRRGTVGDRDGFAYWMNKALKTNERFRAFAVDFFFAVAETERLYILKDVARAIENCGCFLPPVSFEQLLRFRTPAELVRSFQAEGVDLSVDFNKVDINVGYVMAVLAPDVDRRDWKKIAKLDAKTISAALSLKIFYDGFSAEAFIPCYYRNALADSGYDLEIKACAEDYVRMCAEAGEKFRIGYSLEALTRAHDELSLQNRLKANAEELERALVKTPSKFDELEEAIKNTKSTEWERIRTTERLFREGEHQHNCVFSRRAFVRKDTASIYHWDHKGASYTVQFAVDRRGRYSVFEIRARFNRSITQEHLRDLREFLAGICSVDSNLASGFPQLPAEAPRAEAPGGFYPHWEDLVFDDDGEELPF